MQMGTQVRFKKRPKKSQLEKLIAKLRKTKKPRKLKWVYKPGVCFSMTMTWISETIDHGYGIIKKKDFIDKQIIELRQAIMAQRFRSLRDLSAIERELGVGTEDERKERKRKQMIEIFGMWDLKIVDKKRGIIISTLLEPIDEIRKTNGIYLLMIWSKSGTGHALGFNIITPSFNEMSDYEYVLFFDPNFGLYASKEVYELDNAILETVDQAYFDYLGCPYRWYRLRHEDEVIYPSVPKFS